MKAQPGDGKGFIIQTRLIRSTGMSYLGSEIRIVAPVLAGNTIGVAVTITDKRETFATSKHEVANHRGEPVIEAAVRRMIQRDTNA